MIIIIIIYISEFLHEDILQPLNKVWANLKRNCWPKFYLSRSEAKARKSSNHVSM